MRIHRYLLVWAIALAFATAAFSQDVKTDYDHHANFERYHTYYWQSVKTDDPLWQSRVQDAVDHALQAKSWQRVDSNGDVAVAAVGAVHNQREYQTFYDGFGGWRWGGFGREATTTVQNYQVGTVVVDLYDTQSKSLIWRGSASDTLSSKPEKNENKLDKAVDKMFKDFPPNK